MATTVYVKRTPEEEPEGPHSLLMLQHLVSSGSVLPTCLISTNGKQWHPASNVKGLVWPEVNAAGFDTDKMSEEESLPQKSSPKGRMPQPGSPTDNSTPSKETFSPESNQDESPNKKWAMEKITRIFYSIRDLCSRNKRINQHIVHKWTSLGVGGKMLAGCGGLLFIAFSLVVMGGACSYVSDKLEARRVASTDPERVMYAQTLIDAYKSNEVAADDKYKNQIIKVRGIISGVSKDLSGDKYVILGTGRQFELRNIQCYFQSSAEGELSNLRDRQYVVIKGVVDGLMMNVVMRNCVLVE